MERVTGIGGVFFRSYDPHAIQRWYVEHLGLPEPIDGDPAVVFTWRERDDADHVGSTVWSPFPADTDYFGPRGKAWMLNFRVRDLDAMLAQLRAAGVDVDERVEELPEGRFGWFVDPDGNRVELWQPPEGS
ncbi:MAG: VOC family protein [Candidatus Limnocylindrales bacterium]|jgi:predicted enzyme related to lactoylglutathione lyase